MPRPAAPPAGASGLGGGFAVDRPKEIGGLGSLGQRIDRGGRNATTVRHLMVEVPKKVNAQACVMTRVLRTQPVAVFRPLAVGVAKGLYWDAQVVARDEGWTMSAGKHVVDPELKAAGELLKAKGLVALSPATSPIAEARASLSRISVFLNQGSVPLERERNITIAGPHGPIPCRLYLPDGVSRPPLIVYAHGGSFCLGDLDGWDGALRELVRASSVAVLHVDYRLAPEHRFPAAADDMLSVIRAMATSGADFGIDPTRLAVGGDSAGANLALGAALALRDMGGSPLKFLLLTYGAYDTDADSPSWHEFGTGAYGLNRAQLPWIWSTYLASETQKSDFRVAPLRANMRGLPPALLTIGTLDPLQDDNHRLLAKLTHAGVPARLILAEGLNHGFIRYGRLIGKVRQINAEWGAALRSALAA